MTPARRHVGSTYRLQLNGLGFAGAAALVPFLADLGIETCYLSPVTRARAGSTHGYDVCDPTALDPALGTATEFEALLAALAARGMSALLDIVPNHMAASTENPYFRDVLLRGRRSPFAAWFDIAWDEQGGRILLPVLGGSLDEVIARGELRVDRSGPAATLVYGDSHYPLADGTDLDEPLDRLLSRQHYRLADWRSANYDVNYRRFFDINELIGIRQEDPEVFAATHLLVLALLADPRIAGVRVDHIDGLRDPAGYVDQLRAATSSHDPAPVIVVEKILEAEEVLPDWPVEGTTGYEIGAALTGLFVDEYGAAQVRVTNAAATGDLRTFAERAVDAKRRAIEALLPHQLEQIVAAAREAMPDQSASDLTAAIRELTAYLAVYRTYRRPGEPVGLDDLARIDTAAHWARRSLTSGAELAVDRVVTMLAGDLDSRSPAWRATGGWQQFTGPAAAKGVEDTALYDSGRLLAAADVGSDPDRPATSVSAFHRTMAARALAAPLALSATSTHDSKRSHDVRCRLATISEISDLWESTVETLDAELAGSGVGSGPSPDAADRRYLYETLVGAWPVDGIVDGQFTDRIQQCLVKSVREAKRHGSWIDPDEEYEGALGELAALVVTGDRPAARAALDTVVATVETAAAANGLAAALLKLTVPGVPDVYQGDDAWFLRLVDPDNRVPLDVAAHRALLAELPEVSEADDSSELVAPLLVEWRDGRIKQFVIRQALHARRDLAELFATGGYLPLEVTGTAQDHVLAFARTLDDRWVVAVAPRLVQTLVGPGRFPVGRDCWGDSAIVLPDGCPAGLRDRLTGRRLATTDVVELAEVLATLPVALLDG